MPYNGYKYSISVENPNDVKGSITAMTAIARIQRGCLTYSLNLVTSPSVPEAAVVKIAIHSMTDMKIIISYG